MIIVIQRRAEIALRSLPKTDQKQISRAIDDITQLDQKDLGLNPKFHRLQVASGAKKLIYRGNQRLRLVLSIEGEVCNVEDIVDHDRLDQLLKNWEQL